MLAATQPRKSTWATTFAPISETFVGVNTSAGGIQLVGTHEHLMQKRHALVTQAKADTTHWCPLKIKVAGLSSSYTILWKSIKVSQCVAVPLMWFGIEAVPTLSTLAQQTAKCKSSGALMDRDGKVQQKIGGIQDSFKEDDEDVQMNERWKSISDQKNKVLLHHKSAQHSVRICSTEWNCYIV